MQKVAVVHQPGCCSTASISESGTQHVHPSLSIHGCGGKTWWSCRDCGRKNIKKDGSSNENCCGCGSSCHPNAKCVPHMKILGRLPVPAVRFVQMHALFVAVSIVYVLKLKLERNRLFNQLAPWAEGEFFGHAAGGTGNDVGGREDLAERLRLLSASPPLDVRRRLDNLKASSSFSGRGVSKGQGGGGGQSAASKKHNDEGLEVFRWSLPEFRVVAGHSIILDGTMEDTAVHKNDEIYKAFEFAVISNPRVGSRNCGKSQDELPSQSAANCTDHGESADELRRAAARISQLKPDYVVIIGDLVDEPPQRSQNISSLRGREAETIRARQILTFHEILSAYLDPSIPVYVVPSDRDMGTPFSKETLSDYHAIFGHSFYSFLHKGTLNLVLNASLVMDPSAGPEMSQEQDDWLDATLAEAVLTGVPQIFIFSERPLVLPPVSESDSDAPSELTVKEQRVLSRQRALLMKLEAAGVKHSFHGGLPFGVAFECGNVSQVVVGSTSQLKTSRSQSSCSIVAARVSEEGREVTKQCISE